MNAGWLSFGITDGINTNRFCVSYLCDFMDDIDYLLGCNDKDYKYDNYEIENRSIYLDGEGTLLILSIIKHEYDDELTLVWRLNDETPRVMNFNYENLKSEWIKTRNEIKDDYKIHFLMNFDDDEN